MTADPDYSSPTPPGPAPQLPDVALPVLPRVAALEESFAKLWTGASAAWSIVEQLLARVQQLEDAAGRTERTQAAFREQLQRILDAGEATMVSCQQAMETTVQAAADAQVEVQQLADRLAVVEARLGLIERDRG